MNPDVNSGLVAIMMCQCTFIHYNKRSTKGSIDGGGGCVYSLWKISVLLFCCEPRTALKKKTAYKKMKYKFSFTFIQWKTVITDLNQIMLC